MNDSFISRQLTPFREWPDGKKGALFYIRDHTLYEPFWDAIVIIDSPVREEDEIGSHDALHEIEKKAISEETTVLTGFVAFLINRFLDRQDKEHLNLNRFINAFAGITQWKNYYDEKQNLHIADDKLFYGELQAIVDCKKEYLDVLMEPYFSEFDADTNSLFYMAYKALLLNWLKSDQALLYNLELKIRFEDSDNRKWIAEYDRKKRRWSLPLNNKLRYIEGLRAFILNYTAAFAICSDFRDDTSAANFIEEVETLIEKIWGDAVDYDELNIKHRELDIRHIYDAYIHVVQGEIYDVLSKKSLPFTIMDENQKKAFVLKYLFVREWKKVQNKTDNLTFISKNHRKLLDIALKFFFDYIRQLIKDFPDEYNECTALMNPTHEPGEPPVTPEDTPDTMPQNVPLLRNSFIKNLRQVYDILVLENFVLPDRYELFENAMTFRLAPDQHIVWKGKKYELASFIDYAFEGTGEDKWLAATLWSCKGEIQTPAKLKGNLNRIPTDNSVRQWRERFKNLP